MLRKLLIVLWLPALIAAAGCSLVENGVGDATGAGDATEVETGTIILNVETTPANQAGSFLFTGVPSGTITVENTLVVSDLAPGTYTTTEANPAPDFDVTAVTCEETGEGVASSGDAQTRTAVINLDAGETVTCTFTNTRRATAVVVSQTEPGGTAGQFQFTGVPSGTVPTDGTLVVAGLSPGTYTTTQVDPAPAFDLTTVSCDDDGSNSVSGGDPTTRSAIFQLDPGEMVTCVFVNTRRGAAVVQVETEPAGADGQFTFTGVPTGTVSTGGSLVTADLSPGTYTSTMVDPAPDFEITAVTCDDGSNGTGSSGDAVTRSAIFNIDAGETVTCTYRLAAAETESPTGGSAGSGDGESPSDDSGANPFDNPDPDIDNFPLPADLPPDAGETTVPRPGPWTAVNLAGQINCGVSVVAIPATPPEGGTIEVQDGGNTLVASGIADAETATITLTADPAVAGRYVGAFQAIEQGIPITIDYFWQVVTEEYVVGYLTSTFSAEGVTCTLYRPFELSYAGE